MKIITNAIMLLLLVGVVIWAAFFTYRIHRKIVAARVELQSYQPEPNIDDTQRRFSAALRQSLERRHTAHKKWCSSHSLDSMSYDDYSQCKDEL